MINNDEMAKQIAASVISKDKQQGKTGSVTLFESIATSFPNLGIKPYSETDIALTSKVNAYIEQYNEEKRTR